MSFRRRFSAVTRFQFVRWSAIASVCLCGMTNAQTPTLKTDSATELELTAPIRSTLELRVARRPWLLEKLSGKKTEPSQKMDPPQPPVELPDPPSMSRIIPKVAVDQTQQPDRSGKANQGPSYADVPHQDVEVDWTKPKNIRARPAPLRDPLPRPKSISDRASLQLVEPPQSETESTPSEIHSQLTEVAIRELRIEGDGSPVQGSQSHESEADKPPQYVGDLEEPATIEEEPATIEEEPATIEEEPVAVEALAPQTPKRPLDYTGHPREPIELTRDVMRLQGMMQKCLSYYYSRPEIANERSNWGMMHAIMVYGIDTKVIVGRKRFSSIAWIAGNNVCRGQRLLTEEEGNITAKTGVGLQGHQAQLLAVLSLAGVPEEYALYVGKNRYRVADLIDSEMLACEDGAELTFTLIGLCHYLETESEWQNSDGESWNFERLIREELSQPIVGAACGGTHRLLGFAHALRARRAEGLPITGQWKRADQYVQSFIQYTYRLQNRDGSMSTDWYEGREDNGELDRKVQTTGHMVEWLLTVTPDSQLQNPKLVSAIRFLLKSMYAERDREWKIGPKGHALRSLAMYYDRVFQSGPAWQSSAIARSGAGPRNGSRSSRKR